MQFSLNSATIDRRAAKVIAKDQIVQSPRATSEAASIFAALVFMAQQFAGRPIYKMNFRTGRTNDDLVPVDWRWYLVGLVEHVIDALACCRTSEGYTSIHVASSQQTGRNGCAISISFCS